MSFLRGGCLPVGQMISLGTPGEMGMTENASREVYERPAGVQTGRRGLPHWQVSLRSTAWQPPTDLYETEDAYFVRVEVAGMREEDFTLKLDGKLLTIRGTRSELPEKRAYHQMEIRFGEFAIDFELPGAVNATDVKAAYHNGFLQVVLPKQRPHKIRIQE